MNSLRVLVAGVGPVPPHEPEKLYAPGLRLWNFCREIERAGHEVVLCEAMFADDLHGSEALKANLAGRNIRHYPMPLDIDGARKALVRIAAETRPQAAFASTDVVDCALALARLPLPIYLDLYGHPMTEQQMMARVFDSDDGLILQWMRILPALLGGDRFGVSCVDQRSALLGELAACGRLNRRTVGPDPIDVLYMGLGDADLKGRPGAIRGKWVDDDAFVVLYAGGYNTWVDEATLFRGVESAMERDPRIHYVSVGGAIKGHNEKTYERFEHRVRASPFRERFHFVGWVKPESVPDYYREADAAVNVDNPCYEGRLGWRTRIMEWGAAGLPIVSTTISEIAADLVARGLADGFACGDWRGLGEALVRGAETPQALRRRAEEARRYIVERYEGRRVAQPLLAWLENPTAAPDLPPPERRPSLRGLLRPDNSLAACREASWQKHRRAQRTATARHWTGRLRAAWRRIGV